LSRGDRSRPGRERTAAERELDRLERERQRGAAGLPPESALPAESQLPPPAGAEPEFAPIPLSELAQQLAEPAPSILPPEEFIDTPPIRPPRRGRSALARMAAVLALAAVIVAVVLVLRSRDPSSHRLPPPPVVKVLVPEGKTRAQIGQIAAAGGLRGNYRVASRSSPLLSPAAYGGPRGTPDLEGFLFPATYDMNPHAPVAHLVEEQLIAFHENFGVSEIARARALHETPYQLLTVASMVEREAQVPGDRAKIAAVIYNRLAAGMPLGIDATIYYAVELATGIPTYTKELSEAQLHSDSRYNTRTHVGLPPTPISNPGLASIEAAAHPAHVSYLYYVAGADGCGEQVFSNTFTEFEADAAAYKAAVARAGGHPPTCKRKR